MKSRILCLALLGWLPAASAAAADPGASRAGRIFEVGAGGRALGMGSAYTAVARDATSLYYNPSGLGLLDGRQAILMHALLYGGAAYDYLGYAQNFGSLPGGWGLQALRLGVDGAESRDANNVAGGSFGYSETGLGLGFGMRGFLLPDLSLGGGLKVLQRSLPGASDRLFGLDLGAQYGPFLGERITLGFVAHNALKKSSGDTADTLPTTLRAGMAYHVFSTLSLSLDLANDGGYGVGGEYGVGIVFLRAGYAPEGLTFGGGVKLKEAFAIDLAVVNNSTLGMSERVSAGYRFGPVSPRRQETYASEYLANAQGELDTRHYFQASQSLDSALGVDSGIAPEWKRKGARLKHLVVGIGPLNEEEQAVLEAQTEAAGLAHRAVSSYLSGQDAEALLLAEVAASQRDPTFVKFMQSMAQATSQAIARDDVLAPALFVAERDKRAVNAIYTQRYDVAIRACKEALLINPEDPLTWTRLGSALFASGDKTKARVAYQKALSYDPSNEKLKDFIEQYLKQ